MTDVLDEHQLDRYSRQLLMDDINEDNQHTLLESRILVVGAGGLGSAAIQYLAAAGVGTLGIVDDGRVKRSNLQRQIVHRTEDIGRPKVESATRFIEALNPDVTVEAHEVHLEADNAMSLVERYDLVVDGLDNFQGRFLLNDVCQLSDRPFVHGAIFGFEGQVAVFVPEGPCYRCLLPAVPDSPSVPSGVPMGIFPTIPGIIGCIEATEAIKQRIGVGTALDDRLLRYDGLDGTFVTTTIEPDDTCPICGDDTIDSIDGIDYSGSCRIER